MLVLLLVLGAFTGAPQIRIDDDLDWRVIGGADASVGQFPYQTSLRVNGQVHCGGSIISNRWILTAAHCLMEGVTTSTLTVVVGTITINPGGDKYKVERIIVHEKWDVQQTLNDIGLVKTSTNINLGNNVATTKIVKEYIGGGIDAVLSGWGQTSYPFPIYPNKLQFLKLKTISFDECKNRWSSEIYSIQDSHLCTLTKEGEGACSGDSGGPLAKSGEIIGIVSYGHPCAQGVPDVFTRVSSYYDWIQNNAK